MDILINILNQFLTKETIILMSIVLGLTEFIKQGYKHYKRSLSDFQIRLCSFIIGIIMSYILLIKEPIANRIIYGIFYSIASPTIYWFVKNIIVKNISQKLNDDLSGQNKG